MWSCLYLGDGLCHLPSEAMWGGLLGWVGTCVLLPIVFLSGAEVAKDLPNKTKRRLKVFILEQLYLALPHFLWPASTITVSGGISQGGPPPPSGMGQRPKRQVADKN